MNEPIFTRYLYYKSEVVNTLQWSILDKQYDESLYWVYELYFSGFQEEAFQVIRKFSTMYCNEIYPQYENHFDNLYQEWLQNKTDHCIIGTIVKIIVQSRISLTNALRIRQHITDDKISVRQHFRSYNETINLSRLTINEIHKYQTLKLTKKMRNWSFLDLVACKYIIRRVICDDLSIIFTKASKFNFDNWLYYASCTPIWAKRIKKFNGIIDHSTHTVLIDSEEFFEQYDYEPDEQCKELKNMLWNNNIEHYAVLSISDFCDKYGNDSMYKKFVICF